MNEKSGNGELQRRITLRQLYRIAIGGGIGTGLFLASGGSISTAGPGGAIIAAVIVSAMVYFVMMGLAEMSSFMPVTGAYEAQGTRFIDPAMGFALGWNYWIGYAVTIAVELSAGAILMQYWFPQVPGIIWSAAILILILGINICSVKAYGEAEYWFANVKIATILIMLAVGILMICGIINRGVDGVSNYTVGDAPFVGGPLGIFSVMLIVGFSMAGVELVAVTAGEVENPQENLPKAMKTIIWRFLLFYIGAYAVMGAIIPYDNPNLLNSDVENIAFSPFTMIFKLSGIPFAADIMNAVVLIAVLSCTNSSMYICSRTLYGLSNSGKIPKWFSIVNKRGVPIAGLIASAAVGALCFLSSVFGENTVYLFLLYASGLNGFIVWMFISVCHFRFRRGLIVQGYDLNKLPFKAKFFPLGPIFAVATSLLIIIGQIFVVGETSIWGIIMTYAGVPIFLALYFGYKIKHKTKILKLEEIDYSIGDFDTFKD